MRYIVSILLSAVVTFGLFWVMQALIAMGNAKLDQDKGRVIEFVRLKKDTDISEKKRKKPDKRPPPEPPPPPDLTLNNVKPDANLSNTGFGFDSATGVDGMGTGLAITDGDAVPLVRVPPDYPMRAEQRNLEGWVTVEFTISVTGAVKDPKVIDSTNSVFHRAAIRAIRKWKYNPKVVDGNAVEQHGVQVTLDFNFGDA